MPVLQTRLVDKIWWLANQNTLNVIPFYVTPKMKNEPLKLYLSKMRVSSNTNGC